MIDRGPLVMDADERVLHELLRDRLVADEECGEPDHRLVALREQVVEGRGRVGSVLASVLSSTGSVFTSSATIRC